MRHQQMRWTPLPSRCCKTSILEWGQMTIRGISGNALPPFQKIMLNLDEIFGRNTGWRNPTIRKREIQIVTFISTQRLNPALQYQYCQSGETDARKPGQGRHPSRLTIPSIRKELFRICNGALLAQFDLRHPHFFEAVLCESGQIKPPALWHSRIRKIKLRSGRKLCRKRLAYVCPNLK